METFKLSFTAIFANRLRTFLTILGIVIGVMSVILLISLVSGVKSFITNEISGLGSNLIFIVPGKIGSGGPPGGIAINRLTTTHADELKTKLKGEAEVSAAVRTIATVKRLNKVDKDVIIGGYESNILKIIKGIKIAKGRYITETEAHSGLKVAVLGPTVVRSLFGNSSALNQTILLGGIKYKVIGVFEPRGSVLGVDQDNVVLIPLQAALNQFGAKNLNAIYAGTNDPQADVKVLSKKITSILSKRISEDDFTVQTQEQTLQTISQITNILTIALGGIAAISLLVGGIGVMNIMLVSVTERTREIGLRKALGATNNNIRNQFLIEAITLSGLGGIIGIALGVGLSYLINFFFTTTVPLWSVALSFGFSMIVGVVFGVTPAIRAARLDPIQALRYE